MNSHRSTPKNSILQGGGIRAARRRLFDKASLTPFSQRNQRHRISKGPLYNDRQDTIDIQQTKRAQTAARQLAKISSQPPNHRQLSP